MAFTDPDTNQRIPLDMDLAQRYVQEMRAVWAAGECEHERTELRRGFNKGGGPMVRHQCLDCGKLVGNALKRTPETDALPEIDEAQHPEFEAHHKAERDAVMRRYVALQTSRWQGRAEGKSYFQQKHEDYLASPEWAERRSLVMDRASGLCEGCRKAPATEVHHLSYSNWGHEPSSSSWPYAAIATLELTGGMRTAKPAASTASTRAMKGNGVNNSRCRPPQL